MWRLPCGNPILVRPCRNSPVSRRIIDLVDRLRPSTGSLGCWHVTPLPGISANEYQHTLRLILPVLTPVLDRHLVLAAYDQNML